MFSSVLKKAAIVLKENRHVLNYTNYVTSDTHKKRMKTLPKRLLISRDKWFNHKNWPGRMHMPSYHVHYREEVQEVIETIVQSFQMPSISGRRQCMESALRFFQSSMQGLSGHVRIEESWYFHLLIRANPDVDLKFLWHDHKDLHEDVDNVIDQLRQHIRLLKSAQETKSEDSAAAKASDITSLPVPYLKAMLEAAAVVHDHCVDAGELQALVTKHKAEVIKEMKAALRLAAISMKAGASHADLARLYVRRVHRCQGLGGARVLKAMIGFDRHLNTHLGEEEELVVPMELQDKRLQ